MFPFWKMVIASLPLATPEGIQASSFWQRVFSKPRGPDLHLATTEVEDAPPNLPFSNETTKSSHFFSKWESWCWGGWFLGVRCGNWLNEMICSNMTFYDEWLIFKKTIFFGTNPIFGGWQSSWNSRKISNIQYYNRILKAGWWFP